MAQPRKRRPDLPKTRRGYEPYECISAVQKAIRRSQPREAVYWGFELWASGYDNWAWARLNEILSEDIGIADRYLPATIKVLEQTSKEEKKKKGHGGLQFVHAVLLMATANKSRLVDWLVMEVNSDQCERIEIPDEALDRHTRRGLRMGRGWPHFMEHGAQLIDPDVAAEQAGFDDMDSWLYDIDADSENHFVRRVIEKADMPDNPWASRKKFDSESWLPEPPPAEDEEQQQLPEPT
jgi:replication-associated recombination protein RarA